MSEEITTGQSQPKQVLDQLEDKGEEKQPEVLPASTESTEVTPTTEEPKGDLDEGVKERTRQQFEKLKAEKDALKKQLDQQTALNAQRDYPSVVDLFAPTGQQVPAPASVTNYNTQQPLAPNVPKEQASLVDKDGYIITDELTRRLQLAENASKKAEEAERRARDAETRIAKFEQDTETKALYTSYPELDPTSTVFDKDAYDLVRNELTTQIVQSGKRDSMGAAAKMSKYFRKAQQPVTPVQPTAAQQRDQASVTDNTSRQSGESLADLKVRSRRDSNAMSERLRRIGL